MDLLPTYINLGEGTRVTLNDRFSQIRFLTAYAAETSAMPSELDGHTHVGVVGGHGGRPCVGADGRGGHNVADRDDSPPSSMSSESPSSSSANSSRSPLRGVADGRVRRRLGFPGAAGGSGGGGGGGISHSLTAAARGRGRGFAVQLLSQQGTQTAAPGWGGGRGHGRRNVGPVPASREALDRDIEAYMSSSEAAAMGVHGQVNGH